MLTNTMEITNRLLDELKNHPLFEESKPMFKTGFHNTPRNAFPFITIGYPSYREKLLRAGSGMMEYSFEIFVGVRSLAPGVALQGIAEKKKGVAELCDNVRSVISNNTLKGSLFSPPRNIGVIPQYKSDEGNASLIGKIEFDADVWFVFE